MKDSMSGLDDRPSATLPRGPVTRRSLLLGIARAGLVVPGLSLLMAACGGGSTGANTPAPTAASTSAAAGTGGDVAASPAAVPTVSLSQTAGSYKLELRIEPPTRTYTQAQAQQANATTGEILLSGQMPTFSINGTPVAGRTGALAAPGATPGAAFRRFANGTPGAGFRRPADANGTPAAGASRGAFAGTFHQLSVYVTDATSGQPVNNAQVMITITDNTANTAPQDVPVSTLEAVGKGAADFHYGNDVVMPPNRSYTVKVTVNGTPATFSFLLH